MPMPDEITLAEDTLAHDDGPVWILPPGVEGGTRYVLGTVADEDRRKLAIARAALISMYEQSRKDFIKVGLRTDQVDDMPEFRAARIAIAECEGAEAWEGE